MQITATRKSLRRASRKNSRKSVRKSSRRVSRRASRKSVRKHSMRRRKHSRKHSRKNSRKSKRRMSMPKRKHILVRSKSSSSSSRKRREAIVIHSSSSSGKKKQSSPENAATGGGPVPILSPKSTLLRTLVNEKCFNDEDPFTLDKFDSLSLDELQSMVFLGKGKKKHCITLASAKHLLNEPNPKNPYTRERLTDAELLSISNGSGRAVSPQAVLPNLAAGGLPVLPDFSHILRHRDRSMDIEYFGRYFSVIITVRGYVRALIEVPSELDLGGPYTTEYLLNVIIQLWNSSQLINNEWQLTVPALSQSVGMFSEGQPIDGARQQLFKRMVDDASRRRMFLY